LPIALSNLASDNIYTLQESRMPKIEKIKKIASMPMWMFAGILIILVAVYIGYRNYFYSKRPQTLGDNSQRVQMCLMKIVPGQIYEFNLGTDARTHVRVKTLIKIEDADVEFVTYKKGLIQKNLDEELINSEEAHPYSSKIEKMTVESFKYLPLLDCKYK
jgi:hypothetical protein